MSITEAIGLGDAANFGWFYITDIWGWNPAATQAVIDEQANAILSL